MKLYYSLFYLNNCNFVTFLMQLYGEWKLIGLYNVFKLKAYKKKRGEKKMKKNKIAVLSLSILLLGANTVMASDVKVKNLDNEKH